jgi:regulatory protein
MKMDSEEIDEIIAHLNDNFLNEGALPAVCQGNTSSNGKDQNNKRAKIQKNKRSLNQQYEITRRIQETFQNLADRTWENSSETNAKKDFVITYCVKGLRVI